MKLGTQVGLCPGHIVLDGNTVPYPKGVQPSQFSAHVCCGQTAGWIKMPLGREVDLGPGDIVLDGDPAAPKGHSSPIFTHVCCGQMAGWIDDTWYGGRPRPRPHCVRWRPSCPQKGAQQPPLFGPCLLWPNGCPSQLLLSTCYTSGNRNERPLQSASKLLTYLL